MFSKKEPEKATNYFCENCNFKCSHLVHWKRHLMTQKHQNATNCSQKSTEKNNQFFCKKCNFTCHKLSLWNRHLSTSKHQKDPNSDKKIQIVNKYQCQCGKLYSHNASLHRHKLTCSHLITPVTTVIPITQDNIHEKEDFTKIIYKLIENQQELTNKIIEMSMNHSNISNNNSNNTNSHNKFNINFFLNETCKDALNLSDFVQSIQVGLDDLEYTGEAGYAKGIGHIFTKALQNLEVNKRPIHCSNIKHETLYIKDEDKWDKDRNKLTNAIKEVGNKNIKQIPKWQKHNPKYADSESKVNDTYLSIVSNSMIGFEEQEILTNIDKIVTTIAKETTIDKDVLCVTQV